MNNRLYSIWHNMKSRCYYKNAEKYKYYGGKGISVCDEWKNSFEAFYNWALQNGYSEKLTLDRINVNGNYEPNNCRWVDAKTQNNNTSKNHYIEYNGMIKTASEWADIYGVYRQLFNQRIRRGWSFERAANIVNK